MVCLRLFMYAILVSIFGEQWMEVIFPRSPTPNRLHSPSVTAMAANSRLLRTLQLQRIANTSRKFNSAATPVPTAAATPATPTILKSLPEHRPLLPVLLSHSVPHNLAKACADRYDRYADQLRSDTEIKLAPYLLDHHDGQPARIYAVFLNNYSRTLRDWAQSTLNAALKSLKRSSKELQSWDVTYPPPLWLPVCLSRPKLPGWTLTFLQSPPDQCLPMQEGSQVRVVWLFPGLN